MDTANPALSSDGEFTLEPDDNSSSDLLSMLLDFSNSEEVCSADTFVFITNPILTTPSVSHPLRGVFCDTASLPWVNRFKGGSPLVYPYQPWWRLTASFDSTLIGAGGKNLSRSVQNSIAARFRPRDPAPLRGGNRRLK
jgi:hypothetical protein